MVESGSGVAFSVVFFDGEREIDMGYVRIHPSLKFKAFQLMLSQKIGISPNQMSLYLVDCKKSKLWTEDRREIPITGKVNFAAIAREKDCFFLVVLKRSRRDRRRKPNQIIIEPNEYLPDITVSQSPDKLLLLRRNQTEPNGTRVAGYNFPYYNQISQSELVNLNDRLRNLQIQRENYMRMTSNSPTNLNLNSHSNAILDFNSFPRIQDAISKTTTTNSNNRGLCTECSDAKNKGITTPFHHCVNDHVVYRFRTMAGPIGRSPIAVL